MKPIVNMVIRHLMRRLLSRDVGAGARRTGKRGARKKGGAFNASTAQQGIRLLRRFFRSR
ncbi:MAG TPA: hypothetical protein DC031_10960 [Sulfitobacter sp.]|uniref:hypothetical protein n=1 Tax=Sulfitobacter dubius TaxID=218673 RepID=UPI000E8C8DD4|nr:hypothetical protein [Sulfitobacter sp.]